MLEAIDALIRSAASWVWGPPMLITLTGVGIYFTLRLRGLQFARFFEAARLTATHRLGEGEGNITPLQSLFSALGGLIGNGNLAGVATAIAIGGPGAVFWFWTASLVAMIIVYAETYLALSQRERSGDGTYSGGPMYYIDRLLGIRPLAIAFALAMGLKTLMATATIQSNSIALATHASFGVPLAVSCATLAVLTGLVILGGIRSIARTLEKLTPAMVLLFFIISVGALSLNPGELIDVMGLIFSRALTPAGAAGGFAGASVMMAIRYGVARGFYSNEAGTGSSPIMYSAARSREPRTLALIGMFGVAIDTFVGTLTALVILSSGIWLSGETSTALTSSAFSSFWGEAGGYFIFLCSFLFGYTTLIAWCFYGEQCFAYVWGAPIKKFYRWSFCLAICFGFFEPEMLWSWADLMNASTVVINLIAVVFLIRHVK